MRQQISFLKYIRDDSKCYLATILKLIYNKEQCDLNGGTKRCMKSQKKESLTSLLL